MMNALILDWSINEFHDPIDEILFDKDGDNILFDWAFLEEGEAKSLNYCSIILFFQDLD